MTAQFLEGFMQVVGFVAAGAWKILPVFLLSVSLGVLVRALKLDGAIRRAFSHRIGVAILLATAVGAFSPFCSCTVIPLVAGLLIGGVPLAPVMAFWVASPTMDPEIFALSVGFLGWDLAAARLVATLILSLGAGYLTLALSRGGLLGKVLRRRRPDTGPDTGPEREPEEGGGCCSSETVSPASLVPVAVGAKQACFAPAVPVALPEGPGPSCGSGFDAGAEAGPARERWYATALASLRDLSWPEVGRDVAKESWWLGRWLLVAFALEALILAHVPQEAIAGTLGGQNPLAVPLAALVGLPLYMTEVAALPVVSGLLQSGMSPGAALAFLIAGPATTVPAMVAVWSLVRPRVFALYVGIAVVGATVLGLVTDIVL
ncbi:MAG: permease [Rubrobacter sp.]